MLQQIMLIRLLAQIRLNHYLQKKRVIKNKIKNKKAVHSSLGGGFFLDKYKAMQSNGNNNKTEKKLNELLREFNDVDLVIVEGFKKENHPKIEIMGQNSKIVNSEIKNVVAIVADKKTKSNIPLFMRNDVESLTEFIINKFL